MSKLALLLAGLVLLSPSLRGQEQKTTREEYAATVVATGGGAGTKSIMIDFRIDRYATEEEVAGLAQIVREKGTDGLRSALEKLEVGRINPVAGTGNSIAVARKRTEGANTIITMVTARNMTFLEQYMGTRTKDYPFAYLRVQLNEKGEGSGKLLAAARIKFDQKKGHYEIESYGNQYVRVINVRPWK